MFLKKHLCHYFLSMMNNIINNILEQEQQRKENIENTFENNLFPTLNFNNKHMFDIEQFLDIKGISKQQANQKIREEINICFFIKIRFSQAKL